MEIKSVSKLCFLVLVCTPLVNASAKLAKCSCKKALSSCGNLPEVANGAYVLTYPYQDFVGNTASLECNTGFMPSNESTITCLITGLWENSSAICQTNSFAGTSFVTVFPRVTIDALGEGVQIRDVYITSNSAQSTQVNVTSAFNSFSQTLTSSGSDIVSFPINFTLFENATTTAKVISIRSDNPINVFTLDSRDGPSQLAFEAYFLRPIDQLWNEYIIITTDMAPKIVIVGLTDSTEVNITRPEEGPSTINLDSEKVFTLYINDTDTGVNNDLTGTIITASEDVAVFSGGWFSTEPLTVSGSRDLNFVQLLGVEQFYTMCLIGPYKPRNEFVVKVVVSQDNTNLTVFDGATIEFSVLNRGQEFQEYITTGSPLVFRADKPFLVGQFSVNENVGNVDLGDSSLVQCVPPDNFLNRYEFTVPNKYDERRVRVTIPTADTNELRLNGNLPTFADTLSFSSEGVTFVYFVITPGSYVLETANGAFFGAELYGLLKFGQYTVSLGQLYSD